MRKSLFKEKSDVLKTSLCKSTPQLKGGNSGFLLTNQSIFAEVACQTAEVFYTKTILDREITAF